MKALFNRLADPVLGLVAAATFAVCAPNGFSSMGGALLTVGAAINAVRAVRNRPESRLAQKWAIAGNFAAGMGGVYLTQYGLAHGDPGIALGGAMLALSQGGLSMTANIARRQDRISDEAHTGLSLASGLTLLGAGVVFADTPVMVAGTAMTAHACYRAINGTTRAASLKI